ncbi:putative glycoside hydrolase [Monocercomonoides exilis]|uniref:putative glycoside hydrolase n=1 Tax=Monocercomonoides exilis TaxID=2049356 RepID=UPI00355A476B|nr:putative glycoside hydrolase [Monocercomonoides exilis]|eukprot:MONOS_459.1-p1 / transcript=MONOS_459.1 / gene=MONOS_459 / organism=Monocercomonoides_exilis_PA203 / gene_product=putative glycoside hydrolase / transcript_product=putative glycoside hydrolase / location=Mono_scaffold00007:170418-171368(-) / protein_length=253 / sequence_SO=supercontig / SO=protein_coding / is_pseudo=false
MSSSEKDDNQNIVIFGEIAEKSELETPKEGSISDRIYVMQVPEIEEVPTLFEWSEPTGNEAVYISGTFNQWSERIPMHPVRVIEKTETGEKIAIRWRLVYNLSPGTHGFRFIVEGKWMLNPKLAIGQDDLGNKFNVIRVSLPPPRSRSPDIPYTDVIQDYYALSHRDRPTILPAELTQSHLNAFIPKGTEPFLLPMPTIASVQHLFIRPKDDDDEDEMITLSVTTRIRHKYITSQLYMNPTKSIGLDSRNKKL